jgi:hypothetical protein
MYPPGTRVEQINPSTNKLIVGMVMDILFPVSPPKADSLQSYTILFNNDTTASVPLNEMAGLIPLPPVKVCDLDLHDSHLLPFLRLNSEITYEHEGQYHKGYLEKSDGCFRFVFKSHVNKQKEDWSVPLPNLPISWVDLCIEGVLAPGHVSHTFLHSLPSPQVPIFDPVASFVSALNLNRDCPPTLLKSLADLHLDQEVWLKSYQEEKGNLQSLDTYCKITLGKYPALCKKGAPHALPTMYVLTIKQDENLLLQCAKS